MATSNSNGLTLTDADATIYIAKTIAVPADATLVLIDKNSSIYLMEGDVLKGGASATSDLDLFVSYEIIDDA